MRNIMHKAVRVFSFLFALMLVALPCLSFPAMAAEKVEKTITWDGNYSDPSKIVVPPAEFDISALFYLVSSVLVEPDDFSTFFPNTSEEAYTFDYVSDFREDGLPFSAGYIYGEPFVFCFYEEFTFDNINFIDPGIYFMFIPVEGGTQSNAYVKEFVYLAVSLPVTSGLEALLGVSGGIFSLIGTVAAMILENSYLIIVFGFFFIGGCIGIVARLLSRS